MSLKEEQIRPEKIFSEYLRLCNLDTKTYFGDCLRETICCPACLSKGDYEFEKDGFHYELCSNCDSLYVSPRPESAAFEEYYTSSPSVEFWASTFYKETADARREKLWKPKARLVRDTLIEQNMTTFSIVDIGGGYGIFAEEISGLMGTSVTVIEPSPTLASVCRDKKLRVVEKFLEDVTKEDLPTGGIVFVSFELFEHLHHPEQFLLKLIKLMSPGDMLLFTTLSGTGVDIQVLWEESKSICPPHHLNFLNPNSIEILLNRCGFDSIAVTTPGKLDIDILCNNYKFIQDRFWKTFIKQASDDTKERVQESLIENKCSLHMMVCCKKP